jgi:hypothetical protein
LLRAEFLPELGRFPATRPTRRRWHWAQRDKRYECWPSRMLRNGSARGATGRLGARSRAATLTSRRSLPLFPAPVASTPRVHRCSHPKVLPSPTSYSPGRR